MEGFVLLALQTEDEAMSRGAQAVSPDAGKSRETAAPPYGPQEVRPPAACCPSWASDLRNREVIHLYPFSSRICGYLNTRVFPFPSLPRPLPRSFSLSPPPSVSPLILSPHPPSLPRLSSLFSPTLFPFLSSFPPSLLPLFTKIVRTPFS